MPFKIEFNAKKNFVHATFDGEITMDLVKEYIAALIPILEETGCHRVLSDSREGALELSSMDIMNFPKLAETTPEIAALKRAVLARKGTSGYDLYESLSTLQGQNVRVFPEKETALEWLLADED